jgi:hypothetical protein
MKVFERKETFWRSMYEDKIKTELTGLLSEGVYRIRLLQARDQWQALVN